ncbi:MAG TPA: hypothetical protein VIN38_12995 [Thiobacillus sp.]
MRSTLTRFLLIVMMLALPVQTFASAAMLGCAFSHQSQVMQSAQGTHMISGTAAASCHEPEQTEQAPSAQYCKHCTACFLTSAMLIPAAEATLPQLASQPAITSADDAFPGFISDGPDRPPRIHFA